MRSLTVPVLAAAIAAAPLAAQANIFQFNAQLTLAAEIPTPVPPVTSVPSGLATLFYDDKGTPSLADDRYDFSLSAFGLSGGTVPGTAASAFHIHGAANTTETAPVRVALDAAPFVAFNSGQILLVGGDDIVPVNVPATPVDTTPPTLNQGYPPMSLLQMLQSQLAYVNVHTMLNPSGEIRGQLIPVTAIPEPGTYLMLLAGLGLLGFIARRRLR
jgi:hypothetical protein